MGLRSRRAEKKAQRKAELQAHNTRLQVERILARSSMIECPGTGSFVAGGRPGRNYKTVGGVTVQGRHSPDCEKKGVAVFNEDPLNPRNKRGLKVETPPKGWHSTWRWARCPACEQLKSELRQEAERELREKAEAKEAAKLLRKEAMRRTHNHVRRSRELQAPGEHSTAEWLLKLTEFGHRCAYCGTEGEDFHRDHLVPLVDGGSNSIGNIVPACPSCNLSKGGKSGAELLRWIAGRRAGRAA